MKSQYQVSLSAVALVLAAIAAPAHATNPNSSPITAASTCSFGDLTNETGFTVTDCSGYYTGNLNNAADFPRVKTLLSVEFPGVDLGTGIDKQLNQSTSPVSFGALFPLSGDTVIGVHWGGGQGGGESAFYRVTVGAGFDGSFSLKTINPTRTSGGLSNIALFSTGGSVPPTGVVPEPETYALMLAGLAMVGFMGARRKNV